MSKFLSLFLFVAIFASEPTLAIASNSTPNEFSNLEKQMDAFVEKFQMVPEMGIAVGIVRGQELVYFKGYGYRDREKKLPVTVNTRFAIGSVTKNFVSTSFALLQQEGRLRFSDPVRTILPDFELELSEVAKQATFEDIFSHQVGLPRHDFLWYFTPFSASELFQKLRHLENDKREGMGFRSGKMQYNNLMFMVAGLALEKIVAKTWTNYVRDSFLLPLEMNDTTFSIDGFTGGESALGYAREEALPYKSLDSVGPAGSINSTIKDMAKWVAFHLSGSTKNGQLLSQESLENLHKSRSSMGVGGIQLGYGLALMVSKVGDHEVIHHGGNIDGFSAMMAFVPKQNVGIVVLTNQNGAGNFQYPIQVKEKEGQPAISLFPYLILENLLPKSESSGAAIDKNVASSLLSNLDSPSANFDSISKSKTFFLPLDLQAPVALPTSPGGPSQDPSAPQPSSPIFTGSFYEPAYGKLELRSGEKGEQIFHYYNAIFEMKASGKENVYDLHLLNGGGSTGLKVEVSKVGAQVESILVPFEPAVRHLRFVSETSPL